MTIIDISSPRLLPERTRGPLTEQEFQQIKDDPGRAYRLTHVSPKRYCEYFVDEREADIDYCGACLGPLVNGECPACDALCEKRAAE